MMYAELAEPYRPRQTRQKHSTNSMTPAEISALILKEIKNDWDHTNAHGVALRACLVAPELRSFVDVMDSSQIWRLWLVLEENPISRDGYKVVFDERAGVFGLATADECGPDCYLGPYGSFLQALDSM